MNPIWSYASSANTLEVFRQMGSRYGSRLENLSPAQKRMILMTAVMKWASELGTDAVPNEFGELFDELSRSGQADLIAALAASDADQAEVQHG